MMVRCFNKKRSYYKRYGGRGITVCEFLKQSYLSLIEVIGERPKGKTLDRINNDGNYSCGDCDECNQWGWPLNIKWSTPFEQAQNTPRNIYLTIGGLTKCASEWERFYGLRAGIISQRIRKGWSGGRLVIPPIPRDEFVTINGITKNYKDWARHVGINPGVFARRIKRGWSEQELLLPNQKL